VFLPAQPPPQPSEVVHGRLPIHAELNVQIFVGEDPLQEPPRDRAVRVLCWGHGPRELSGHFGRLLELVGEQLLEGSEDVFAAHLSIEFHPRAGSCYGRRACGRPQSLGASRLRPSDRRLPWPGGRCWSKPWPPGPLVSYCPAGVAGATTVLRGAGGGGMVPGCVVPRPALAPVSPSGLCTPCTAALATAPLLTISTARACT
jgi:hypothetical protein